MHLVSLRAQTVHVAGAVIALRARRDHPYRKQLQIPHRRFRGSRAARPDGTCTRSWTDPAPLALPAPTAASPKAAPDVTGRSQAGLLCHVAGQICAQLQPRAVDPAFQGTDRAAGLFRRILVGFFLQDDHEQRFTLVRRQRSSAQPSSRNAVRSSCAAGTGTSGMFSMSVNSRLLRTLLMKWLIMIRCTQAEKFVPGMKQFFATSAFVATSCVRSSAAARLLVKAAPKRAFSA